uniref:Uncharacterized protein n=1 Tax=Trichuris muris TaxID=70415 RepID=A0A5S6Q289_TRIMR
MFITELSANGNNNVGVEQRLREEARRRNSTSGSCRQPLRTSRCNCTRLNTYGYRLQSTSAGYFAYTAAEFQLVSSDFTYQIRISKKDC